MSLPHHPHHGRGVHSISDICASAASLARGNVCRHHMIQPRWLPSVIRLSRLMGTLADSDCPLSITLFSSSLSAISFAITYCVRNQIMRSLGFTDDSQLADSGRIRNSQARAMGSSRPRSLSPLTATRPHQQGEHSETRVIDVVN
jgi:hypothetical protein